MTKVIPKGHKFEGPDGMGYELMRDFNPELLPSAAEQFRAYGGAPEPMPATPIPVWLLESVKKELSHDQD